MLYLWINTQYTNEPGILTEGLGTLESWALRLGKVRMQETNIQKFAASSNSTWDCKFSEEWFSVIFQIVLDINILRGLFPL